MMQTGPSCLRQYQNIHTYCDFFFSSTVASLMYGPTSPTSVCLYTCLTFSYMTACQREHAAPTALPELVQRAVPKHNVPDKPLQAGHEWRRVLVREVEHVRGLGDEVLGLAVLGDSSQGKHKCTSQTSRTPAHRTCKTWHAASQHRHPSPGWPRTASPGLSPPEQ